MTEEKKTNTVENKDKNAVVQPDPETLNTTDPQDHMEGPVSSLLQKTKKAVENTDETKESADKKKEKNM